MKSESVFGDLENDYKNICKVAFALLLAFLNISLSAHEITLHGLREGGDMYCFTLFVFGIILPCIVLFIIANKLVTEKVKEDILQHRQQRRQKHPKL